MFSKFATVKNKVTKKTFNEKNSIKRYYRITIYQIFKANIMRKMETLQLSPKFDRARAHGLFNDGSLCLVVPSLRLNYSVASISHETAIWYIEYSYRL